MKNKPLWKKVLAAADVVCLVVCIICLSASIWMGFPENEIAFILRGVYYVLMGLHFVLHGILYWEEQRGLAIFELGAVAFVMILTVLSFLR